MEGSQPAVGPARVARWALAACLMAALLVPFVVLPSDAPVAVGLPLLIEVVVLAVLLVAATRMAPGARSVWWALWLMQLLTLAADAVYDYQQFHLGVNPFPGWADPLYLASYVPEVVAVALLVRYRHPRRNWEQWLDSAIISVPIVAVVSVFVLLPMVDGQDMGLATVVALAYPLMDTVILIGLIRLLVGGGRPNVALALVACSVTLTLLADLTFNALVSQDQVLDPPGWMQALFSLGAMLLAAGALSRSAGQVHVPTAGEDSVMSPPRAVSLGLSTLALPFLLLVGTRSQTDAGVRVFALALFVANLMLLVRAVLLLRVVKEQRQELSRAARTDALTGLPNRRSWDFELERAWAWAQAAHASVTVAMIDLDHFKDYNDEFGHQPGDQLLIDCARAWSSVLPDEAYLARYGGDEFALLLPGLDLDEAGPALTRLRCATPAPVTASIGYAHHHPGTAIGRTVAEADTALYAAKAHGRDTVLGPDRQIAPTHA